MEKLRGPETTSNHSPRNASTAAPARLSTNTLRRSVLSRNETLAQSVALIAPTAAPLLAVPLVYASAGSGTWLAFLVSMLTILLVALNVNHFARISSSPGSLYSYISTHMHPVWGVVTAWALVVAYFGTATALAAAFSNYFNVVLKTIWNSQAEPLVVTGAVVGLAAFLAYRDVSVSARLMLVLEIGSVALICFVAMAVLVKHGFRPDMAQLQLRGVTAEKLRMGLVLAIFCLVGFESATSLGSEAKDPLRSIPRAVIWSGILAGLFFCFCAYTEVLGFGGHSETLDKSIAPFQFLARDAGLPVLLALLINVGAVVSFFSCLLACLTAGARILFLMGKKGALPSLMGRAHSEHQTPHCAVLVSAVAIVAPLELLTMRGVPSLDVYGYLGTLATFGFLVAYILVCVAAPMYLRRMKRLTKVDTAVSVAALLAMGIAFLGSLYPVPPPPYNVLPYVFLGIVVMGTACSLLLGAGSLTFVDELASDLDLVRD